jgi:hypothetical protein
VFSERLEASERFGKSEDLEGRQESLGLLETTLDVKYDHSGAASGNSLEDFVLWMRRKTGVADADDSVVRLEELGASETVFTVSLHSNVKSLETSVDEVAVEGGRNSSDGELGEHELLLELVRFHGEETHDHVGVAVHVLGCGVHDNIGTEVQRSGIVAREEGVVNTDDDVLVDGVDLFSNGLDVTDTEKRVGHELEPNHLGVWLDGGNNVVGIADIDHGELDSVLGGDSVEVTVSSAVKIISGDSMVAVLKECFNH